MCARVNEIYLNTNSVHSTTLRMGTTCIAAFFIGGVTFYSVLYLPVNIPFTPLYGCYFVNRYKPLQNWLLRKPLQTVTNGYKPLQTSYSVNCYEPLQTVTNHLRHKPL